VRAKVIPLDQSLREDAAVLDTDGNGDRRLLEIRFLGQEVLLPSRTAIRFDDVCGSTIANPGM
jgi:hypothetical protein